MKIDALYTIEQLYMQFPPNEVYATSDWAQRHLGGRMWFVSPLHASDEANHCFFPALVQKHSVHDGKPGWSAGLEWRNFNRWLCPYYWQARAITLGMIEPCNEHLHTQFVPTAHGQRILFRMDGEDRLFDLDLYMRAYWEHKYAFIEIAETTGYIGSQPHQLRNWVAIPKEELRWYSELQW